MWVAVSLGVFSLVLGFVWSALWKQSVTEYLPYLLSGLIPWMLIASCVGESTNTFMGSEALIRNRQFSYSMLNHVVLARNSVLLGHNLLTYAIAAIFCGVHFSYTFLLVLPGLILLLINLAWICLIISILCLRFRDFQQLVTISMQVVMFITPVFWPASQLTGRKSIIIDMNILYHMIALVREPLLGKAPSLFSYYVCLGSAIFGWAIAFWLFSTKRHRLVYWF